MAHHDMGENDLAGMCFIYALTCYVMATIIRVKLELERKWNVKH